MQTWVGIIDEGIFAIFAAEFGWILDRMSSMKDPQTQQIMYSGAAQRGMYAVSIESILR